MKIYVIYSFADKEIIEKLIVYLKRIIPDNLNNGKTESKINNNLEIFHFPAEQYQSLKGELWRKTAWENMLDANFILLCLDKYFSGLSENILWEINLANKLQKEIYLLELDSDLYENIGLAESNENINFAIPESKFNDDLKNALTESFGVGGVSVDQNSFIITSVGELETYIRYHQPKNDIKSSLFPKWGERKIVSYSNLSDTDKNILMEQYKLMLTSSESMIDRRQSVSSFYITLNCAIFAFIGAISTFSSNLLVLLVVALVMSMFGIGLSVMWMKMIDSYGALNNGKFKIINAIEKVLPAAVFDAEWIALQSQEKKKKYVSFTEREKNTPKLFGVLYLFALIAVAVVFLMIVCGIIVM